VGWLAHQIGSMSSAWQLGLLGAIAVREVEVYWREHWLACLADMGDREHGHARLSAARFRTSCKSPRPTGSRRHTCT
jgi:hypothetical protein